MIKTPARLRLSPSRNNRQVRLCPASGGSRKLDSIGRNSWPSSFLVVAVALVVSAASAFAQEKAVTVADFAGTWNIEAMSHQIALVVEPAEGNKVNATMMMMGRDMLLKGELTGRTLTLVGVKTESHGAGPAGADHAPPAASAPGVPAKPIIITLQEDGTIVGEMMTNMGPVKWTGEKLKAKKKG
jgi:hypothetical protein